MHDLATNAQNRHHITELQKQIAGCDEFILLCDRIKLAERELGIENRIPYFEGLRKQLFDEIENVRQANMLAVAEEAEKYGITVVQRESIHQKAAIIDDCICWEGSLNILSHNRTREV